MSFLWTILLGFLAGVVAKFVHPGRENMGFIMTTVLGVVGSLVAGYVGQALNLYSVGQGAGFVGSVLGAVALLFVYGWIKGRSPG
jgi:uncharacterized membrane protein YeaQ/YmgE (transglycosylase-associated protein family)